MCARRKEAFGYDGDKFELEDFAAENCEYVGSVCYGCAGRGGEGREGRREVGRDLSGGLISLVVVVVVLVFFFLPSSSSSFL